jgi:hypothetical protein
MNNLNTFSLLWRFTDPRYVVLPQEELNEIKPTEEDKRKEIYESVFVYAENYELNSEKVEEIEIINLENREEKEIIKWIKDKIEEEKILIVWDTKTSVYTNKNLFIKYWSDFLYPSSDDAIIISESKKCVLYYMHDNILCYGKIKKTQD